MNPSLKRASNPGPVLNASGYCTPDSGNISDTVTIEDLEILDASVGSMSIGPGGKMYPAIIQVRTNNLVEVSRGRVKRKCTLEKRFKYLILMFCFLFLLITGISLGIKHSGETETLKQCLPGYYSFPECIKCECTSDGSILDCNENGDCICKHGFGGSKCDKCKEGFTGNKCNECEANITGHNCNQCKLNYFNYPLCQECVCNSNGSTTLECGKNNGVCTCKEGFAGIKCQECMPNVVGDECDTCEPGFFAYPSCQEECKCNPDGSTTLDCGKINGDCFCKEGFAGLKCDECSPNVIGDKCDTCQGSFFNYPACQDCQCHPEGSIGLECDSKGDCSCREGYAGVKCHECLPNVVGDWCDKCQTGFFGYPSCREDEKILIATGFPPDDGINSEIVDVENSNFSCTNIEQFPIKLLGATGGLMNGQKTFICGGTYHGTTYPNDCFQLTEFGSWAKDQTTPTLTSPRAWAGYGTVVLNNNLVLTGGYRSGNRLSSIELMSPNTSETLSVQLPTGLSSHCQVPWDFETFLVIGGYGDSSSRDETYLINVKTNQLTNGPSLNTARNSHACAELQLNGKTYIVVSGGQSYEEVLRSTEVLDKSNVGQGWQKVNVFDLPVDKSSFQMVSSPDKKALYAIGGYDNGVGKNDIYKFHCTGAINTCRWTKSETTLRFGRSDFVAIPIPNSLAENLCT